MKRVIFLRMTSFMDNKAPRVTLRQWAVFAAIAQCETTTAAGSQLGLSQSAVSAALAELESTLGHPLFDRHARRLHLNALGRQLLPQAQALLDHADALEHATVQPNVRLKLAASSTIGNYVLPALLASFRQQIAPDSQLDVLIGNTQDVVDAVQRFEVDIGLIEGTCRGEALEIETWIDDEMVIVAAPDHPLARGPASRAALREAGWLMRGRLWHQLPVAPRGGRCAARRPTGRGTKRLASHRPSVAHRAPSRQASDARPDAIHRRATRPREPAFGRFEKKSHKGLARSEKG